MSTHADPGGTGLRGLVRRRPLTSFFALAYGVTWLCTLPYVLSTSGLGVWHWTFPEVLGTTQFAGILPGAYLGPLTAAFVVTAVADGRTGLRHWAHRLVHWRVGVRWYAAVLVGVPAAILLATLAVPGAWGSLAVPGAAVLAAYLPLLLVQVVTTAMAEEPGWRDFALPRLQRRFGPLLGTVVLGVLWGGWHLPLFLTGWGGWPHVGWTEPVEFVATCVPLSIVMTWVFNRTGQSLPIVMVLHAGINTTMSLVWAPLFPGLDFQRDTAHALLIAATAVTAVLVVATRGRLGLAPEPAQRPAQRPAQQPAQQPAAQPAQQPAAQPAGRPAAMEPVAPLS